MSGKSCHADARCARKLRVLSDSLRSRFQWHCNTNLTDGPRNTRNTGKGRISGRRDTFRDEGRERKREEGAKEGARVDKREGKRWEEVGGHLQDTSEKKRRRKKKNHKQTTHGWPFQNCGKNNKKQKPINNKNGKSHHLLLPC